MADLLYNSIMVLLVFMLGLIALYIVLRVGTLAVLKTKEEFTTQQRKQQLAKSTSANN